MQKRYERNSLLIGDDAQLKLGSAKVLVVGAGGLGSPVLYYLAVAGIGHIGICDGDTVSISNLNRQILYTEEDVGKVKAKCAAECLQKFNSLIEFNIYPYFLDSQNAENIFLGYDMVVDCLDNLPARYILNDACLNLSIPFVHGGISEYYGQLITVIPHKTPCFRCFCPERNSGEIPVSGTLGATAGVIGSVMAMEVIKYILGKPINTGSVLYFDGIAIETEKVVISINPNCKCQK